MPQTFAIIAGGGTAGHVVPGLAIASALTERGLDSSQIHYVGSARGIENRLVPAAGFPLTVLPGRGIQRRLTSANVRAAIGLVAAIVRGIVLVRRLRPAVVVALGGYASVPCVIGAVLWRVPIVVAEQNAVPGAANRLASRFARACAVSFADVDLPRATWTGNPVRPEVLAVANTTDAEMRAARNRIGIGEDRVLVAVFGGSLGARRINNAIADAVPGWHQRADLAVRHVTGAGTTRRSATAWPRSISVRCNISWWSTKTTCRPSMPRPTWSSVAPAPRRSPNSRWSVQHRFSCHCPARPVTIRPPTRTRWSAPGPPFWSLIMNSTPIDFGPSSIR